MTARPEDDPVTDGAVLGDRRQEDEGTGHETSSQGWHCLREGGRKAGDQRDGTDTWILGGMGLSDDMETPCVTCRQFDGLFPMTQIGIEVQQKSLDSEDVTEMS